MISRVIDKYKKLSIVARASLWLMVCSILQRGISFITTPIFTRLMTTEEYGQFSVYSSWLNIITIATTLRLNGAVFNKGMSKYKSDRDAYTATMQTITFIIAIIISLLFIVFRDFFGNLTELPLRILLLMLVELMFAPAIDFWTVRNRYEYLYKPVVYRTLAMAVLNAVLGIVSVLTFPCKGYARIMSCILVNISFGIALFLQNYRKSDRLFVAEYAKFALTFNIPLLLHYFSQYILDQFDRIMVQKLVSISATGIYGIAYNIGLLLRIVTSSINNAITPWQYECLENKKLKQLDDTMFRVFISVAGCSFLLSAFAPEIMKILAEDEYYSGVYVVPPVALGLFFSFMYTTFANIEFFYNKNKFSMYISVVGAILNIVLNYIGIRLFGFVAAAYTTLICYVLFALGHYTYMTLSVNKSEKIVTVFDTKRLLILSSSVLLLGLIVIVLYDIFFFRYGIVVGMIALVYCNRKKIKDSLNAVKNH